MARVDDYFRYNRRTDNSDSVMSPDEDSISLSAYQGNEQVSPFLAT